MVGEFKFERLEVWKLRLDYLDLCYAMAEQLPRQEEYNLKTQITRAATSIALNIAEGSTSQSDAEQARFLGLSLRSLIEAVACRRLMHHRDYMETDADLSTKAEEAGQKLFAKLHAMRRFLAGKGNSQSAVRDRRSSVNNCNSSVVGRPSSVN
ncbi:MAG TPA: four helix bundle protein [Methylomirabilota bacterium]|nr:four helix bundle protein [Methylomirabilota bacterium]